MSPARTTSRPRLVMDRDAAIPGLAACACCGFEARGAIRKAARPDRAGPLCRPCAARGADGEAGKGWVAVWAPETSQAALAALVRTAHVILHLHGDAPVAGSRDPAGDDMADFLRMTGATGLDPAHADAAAAGGAARLAEGAGRIVGAVTYGRAFARSFVERRLARRLRGRPDGEAELARRLALGTRYVPEAPSPEEVEGWVEGGGTYAGWTVETLAAQLP